MPLAKRCSSEQLEGLAKVVGEHPLADPDEHRRHDHVASRTSPAPKLRSSRVGSVDTASRRREKTIFSAGRHS